MPAARAARPSTSLRRARVARPQPRARQQRGVRTEEAILQATLRLLAARGVQGTSLDLLAEEVGVAKSSILWHFGSKEELLLRVTERVFEEVTRGPVRDILALPTLEARGEATWRFYSDAVRRRPELFRVMSYLLFEAIEGRPELRTRLRQLYRGRRQLFAEGLRGVVQDEAQRRRLAALSVAAFDGIFLQWLLDPEALDLEALHREMRTLAERARRPGPRKGSTHG
jgi:AcrR family transcriptional regulator